MSAICGVFALQSNLVFQDDITLMLDSLAYSGADSTNFWNDGVLALGQQKLNITPESFFETLPLNNVGDNLAIVADIRLDNRKELFEKLSIPPIEHKMYGDGHLLLTCYQKWGETCVEHLLGDFAFAIWDRDKRKLFLGRDHLGLKTLFYYTDGKRFIFASEPKAILAIRGVENRVNKNKLAVLAMPQAESLFSEESWFENIIPLKPASSLTIDVNGNINKRTFWLPEIKDNLPFKREDEILEAFRELVFETISSRIRSNFPITALLSGGLDSSAIVGIAAKILEKQNKQLHTLSVVLPNKQDVLEDERCYIDLFKTFQNVSINYITDPDSGPFDNIEELVWANDAPSISSRHYLFPAFAQCARKNGSRIILHGSGGESGATFYGTGSYAEMFTNFRWFSLWRELKLRKKLNGESLQYNLRANVISPLVPDFIYKLRHPNQGFIPVKNYPLDDSFAKTLVESVNYGSAEFNNLAERISANHKVNQILEIKSLQNSFTNAVIRFAGSENIEYKFPLMDKRILEFCLAVPYNLKVKNGYQRYMIRAGFDKILPRKIQWRTSKMPFSPDYFRRYKKQRVQVLDLLNGIQVSDPIRQVIDIERLKNMANLPVKDDDFHTYEGKIARDFVPNGIYLIYFLRRFAEFQN